MLFYPITYENIQEGRYDVICIICYNEKDEKIVIRVRYPSSLIVSGEQRHILEENVSSLVGVTVRDEAIHARSTRDPTTPLVGYRIDCDNSRIRAECIRLLQNRQCKIHEINNMLAPLLKMMQERSVKYYSWMDIDVEEAETKVSCYNYKEYIGNCVTLRPVEEVRPAPSLSIFSFDLECNSTDWDVMCDAARDLGNDIKMGCITYTKGDYCREYAIVYGPDIKDFWHKVMDEDIRVITAKTELHLIQLLFGCIKKFDPDVIIGHNIAGFDIPYIIQRQTLLSMMSKEKVSIPNISRLEDYVVKPYRVEWNNSAVSVSGSLLNTPGRIWIDTLILASRGFLGTMENNKLDTLAKVHLGMTKNNVSHKDMFAWFSLYDKKMKGLDITEDLKTQYAIGISKYNQVLPPIPQKVTVDSINDVITMINVMNQRGIRTPMVSKKEGMSMDLMKKYEEVRERCQQFIEKWNVAVTDDPDEMLKTLWWIVARYCIHDTRIPSRVVTLLDIIPVLMEQSNLFCVPISDILCRGQMHAVQASQYGYAKQKGFLVDLVEKGDPSNTGQVGGGLVGGPHTGLLIKDHDSVMIVVDFNSLYPSIIIAMNICYTTWVPYEKRGKEVTEDMCNIITVDDLYDKDTGEKLPTRHHWFLKKEILEGIVPSMLDQQRLSRISIKEKMKTCSKDMYTTYNAQQLAVKVGMNSAYGAFGTEHSYICNKACADATTGFGRQCIRKCNKLIEDEGLHVAYNDTDSAMTLVEKVRERFLTQEERSTLIEGSDEESAILVERVMQFGDDLAKRLSEHFPDPMALDAENYFLSFFLKGRKMYTAIKWDKKNFDLRSYGMKYIEANNLLYVKGLASARRDKYPLYKEIYNKILELILTKTNSVVIIRLLEKYIEAIWRACTGDLDPKKIEKHFTYNIGISYKALASASGTMGKWIPIYEQANKRKPLKGERFKLVVCETTGNVKHTKSEHSLRTVDWMKREGKRLDVQHYLGYMDNKGGIIELLNMALGDEVPLKCVTGYYLPKLIEDGHL